ncbi:hypothetical protein CRENBAI_016362 [Crenichthys baileyi]|uniref:Uncharacterized protein n=1 Tax=Crenichthys baileyi TaxID=28760 RepID=A0AAV9RDL9_9TELE
MLDLASNITCFPCHVQYFDSSDRPPYSVCLLGNLSKTPVLNLLTTLPMTHLEPAVQTRICHSYSTPSWKKQKEDNHSLYQTPCRTGIQS